MQRRYRLRRMRTASRSGDPFWQALLSQEPAVGETQARLLREGEVVAYEVVPWGSNYTFLVALADDDGEPRAIGVYKPAQGEAPLWDFPDGCLYRREYAAYLTSQWLGWHFIPETVIRDGPYGIGTMQQYVEAEDDAHYYTLRASHPDDLQRITLFDLLVNNADRKAGHVFKGTDGRVYGIDHGLTFHVHPKLRTVIWDFIGQPIPDALLNDLATRLDGPAAREALRCQLAPLLAPLEIERFFTRAERLLALRVFPGFRPGHDHNIPWGFA